MPTSFTLTADRIVKLTLEAVKPKVEKATNELYMQIRMFSPVRTGVYISGHRNLGVRIEGNKVIGEVMNQGNYPERVEFGFWRNGGIWNRYTAVRWHLMNGQIFYNKGANTYQKALLKIKPSFLQSLKW